MHGRLEVGERTLVPVDADDRTLVLASDGLELILDFRNHFHVDRVRVSVKLEIIQIILFLQNKTNIGR